MNLTKLNPFRLISIISILFVFFGAVTIQAADPKSNSEASKKIIKEAKPSKTEKKAEEKSSKAEKPSKAVQVAKVAKVAGPWEPIGNEVAGQSDEAVKKKSAGCDSCHQGIEKMHADTKIKLGCTDCHGGNAENIAPKDLDPKSAKYTEIQNKSHILPKNKKKWPTSANPERSYTDFLEESPEFVRFINPGDLRVADKSCGGNKCHSRQVNYASRSIMATGSLLWGAATYNNGILDKKNYFLGESYSRYGKPLKLNGVAIDQDDGTVIYRELKKGELEKGVMPTIFPLPRWNITKPGNVFRSFERGGIVPRANASEVGDPGLINTIFLIPTPGKPDMKTGERGLGTELRIDTPTLNIHKTRLNDPNLWFLGTNDHAGDFRSSGCSACHVVYANNRDEDASGPWAKYGNKGLTATKDKTIPKNEKGHPIKHQFTNAIPSSQCLVCHMHQPNAFVNTYLGYQMWDYETDAEFMYPKETPKLTSEELAEGYQKNPEGAVNRGKWRNEDFLEKLSELNPKLNHTQFADYHGHGWVFRGVFKKDREGNLLDKKGEIIDLNDKKLWEKAVHMKDIHAEKGMHCVDCHFSQDAHGDGKMYGAYKDALEIQCVDCHGDVDYKTKYVTSGPASNGGDLKKGKTPFGKQRFGKSKGSIIQRSMLYEDKVWKVPQVMDTIDPENKDFFNPKARYAKTIQKDLKTWGGVPTDKKKLAHTNDKINCYTCHTGFVTNCFGCHLPFKLNYKQKMRHYEGTDSKAFTTYNPQVLRDDSFMLAKWDKNKNGKIAPARSSSALILSAKNGDRETTYLQQPPVSASGYSSQSFNPHYPHNVRKEETKECQDCHISKENDNNAWMAQLFLHGTNFVNFFGKFVYLGLEDDGLEAVSVTEFEEPQAVIGSHAHKFAYPKEYREHEANDKQLRESYGHGSDGTRSLQLRGEYLFAADGEDGFRVYDVANIDNKGFSQRIVTSPVSPLGQVPYVRSKFATDVALPTNMPVDPNKKQLPENEEWPMHPIYKYAFFTDRFEGLIGSDVTTFIDGNPRNNFIKRDVAFNPGGQLTGAEAITLAGHIAYISVKDSIKIVDLNDPLKPKIVNEIKGFSNPKRVAIQFRYGFVVDDQGLKVIDVTFPEKASLVKGAAVNLAEAYDVYVARTYAYVAGGKSGLIIVDVKNPEEPKVALTFNADGKMDDVRGVKVGAVSSSLFAMVADGKNGLRVVQLRSPGDDGKGVGHFGFSPRPKPKLIASKKLSGKAITVSKGLDRDRAIDETGNQVSVFGRKGSYPLSLEEQRHMYLKDGKVWTVANGPETEPVAIVAAPKASKKKRRGRRSRKR